MTGVAPGTVLGEVHPQVIPLPSSRSYILAMVAGLLPALSISVLSTMMASDSPSDMTIAAGAIALIITILVPLRLFRDDLPFVITTMLFWLFLLSLLLFLEGLWYESVDGARSIGMEGTYSTQVVGMHLGLMLLLGSFALFIYRLTARPFRLVQKRARWSTGGDE